VGNIVMVCDSDCFPCEIMVKGKSKVAATSTHILLAHINWLASVARQKITVLIIWGFLFSCPQVVSCT
jgi:hypothetical protein